MQYFDRVWKPWKWVKSFGPLFVCIIGIASVYIGQVFNKFCEKLHYSLYIICLHQLSTYSRSYIYIYMLVQRKLPKFSYLHT